MNSYGFAGGDPVNFSDPFGLSACCEAALKVANVAAQAAIVNSVAKGGTGKLNLGTIQPGSMPSVFGESQTAPMDVSISLDADGNAVVNFRGALTLTTESGTSVVITEVGINLGTGWFAASGHIKNLPLVSSVGVVGNVIGERATYRATVLGVSVQSGTITP